MRDKIRPTKAGPVPMPAQADWAPSLRYLLINEVWDDTFLRLDSILLQGKGGEILGFMVQALELEEYDCECLDQFEAMFEERHRTFRKCLLTILVQIEEQL